MNLTSTNIDNRLLLAKCCYSDYAIKYLEKRNIGDNEQAKCYMSKMKQLYYSMQALNQFVPAAELAPTVSISFSLFTPSFTGTRQITVDGEELSAAVSFTNASAATQVALMINAINLYQTDFIASFSGSTFTITSALSGTTNNGLEVSLLTNGSIDISGDLAGGAEQWCLTDTKAQKILENIDELCGCPCDCNDDLLDDTLPRYITN